MIASRTLHVDVRGRPPAVRLTRGPDIPDEFWHALPLRLSADGIRTDAPTMDLPTERLLAGRRRLAAACISHDVGLDFSETALALLDFADRDREALRRAREAPPIIGRRAPAPTGERFVRPLRWFQRRDLRKLAGLRHGANFSVPGAGKTAVAYALHDLERSRGIVERLLVVAPLSAFEAWTKEAERCLSPVPKVVPFRTSASIEAAVLLVNYERLVGHFAEISQWVTAASTHVILDEAHRMKRGRDGERGAACLDLAHLATRRDILTGTPAPQSPRDFVALMEFLWPTHATRILPAAALQRRPTDADMRQLSRAIAPLFARTTKRELRLRRPTLRTHHVPLGGLQREIYEALRNRYAGMFELDRAEQATFSQMGEVTMYLLEAASNPALLARRVPDDGPIAFRYPQLAVRPGSRLGALVERYHDHELPPKFARVIRMADRLRQRRRKLLVWSNFVDTLDALERLLKPFAPAVIHGNVPPEGRRRPGRWGTRDAQLERFRHDRDCWVLLANPAAIAEGISLHDVCHDAVYVDRTFNAGQYLQSVDRIHRLGLRPGTHTTITFLVTHGTIDEAVDERIHEKARRLADMLNDSDLTTMAIADEEEYGDPLEDSADLDRLLGHLRA